MHLGQQVMDRRGKGALLGKGFVLEGLLTILSPQVWIPTMAFVRQDQPAVKNQILSGDNMGLSRENKEEGLGFDGEEAVRRLQRPCPSVMLCFCDYDPGGMEVQVSEDPVVALVGSVTTLCCSSPIQPPPKPDFSLAQFNLIWQLIDTK